MLRCIFRESHYLGKLSNQKFLLILPKRKGSIKKIFHIGNANCMDFANTKDLISKRIKRNNWKMRRAFRKISITYVKLSKASQMRNSFFKPTKTLFSSRTLGNQSKASSCQESLLYLQTPQKRIKRSKSKEIIIK